MGNAERERERDINRKNISSFFSMFFFFMYAGREMGGTEEDHVTSTTGSQEQCRVVNPSPDSLSPFSHPPSNQRPTFILGGDDDNEDDDDNEAQSSPQVSFSRTSNTSDNQGSVIHWENQQAPVGVDNVNRVPVVGQWQPSPTDNSPSSNLQNDQQAPMQGNGFNASVDNFVLSPDNQVPVGLSPHNHVSPDSNISPNNSISPSGNVSPNNNSSSSVVNLEQSPNNAQMNDENIQSPQNLHDQQLPGDNLDNSPEHLNHAPINGVHAEQVAMVEADQHVPVMGEDQHVPMANGDLSFDGHDEEEGVGLGLHPIVAEGLGLHGNEVGGEIDLNNEEEDALLNGPEGNEEIDEAQEEMLLNGDMDV